MKKILFLFLIILLQVFPANGAGPEGYLIIEKISLYKSISMIEDSDLNTSSYFYNLADLQHGVGHLQYTSWGNTHEKGRTVLVGHTPGAFERLQELELGDEIVLSMNDTYYTFSIFDKYIVNKSNDAVLSTPAYQFELVLITCVDTDRRLIIKAK